MKSVDDPDKLRKIEKESKTHHARADGAYKALENDGDKGEVTKIQFVLIWNRCIIALRWDMAMFSIKDIIVLL